MERQKVRGSLRILKQLLYNEDYEALNNLLQRGSNANEVDYEGNGLLHYAVYQKNFKIVELLLQHNAQVDIEGDSGIRPLDIAVISRNFNIVKILLQYKAEVRVNNIFDVLFKERYPENIKKLLYENVNVEHADSIGHNALHYAVEYDDLNGVRTLISRGADVNKVTEPGRFTPLHYARSIECIKILLQAGAEPNVQDEDERSPLYTLVANSELDDLGLIKRKEKRGMIEELIRNGANCIELIDRVEIREYEASSELRYYLEDVLRFMALKEHGHHEVNIDDSRFNFVLSSFYGQCLNEVVLLKEEKLLDDLTYYNFATKNIHELSKHFDNKSLKKSFKIKSKLIYMFPIYSEILWGNFKEAQKLWKNVMEERKIREAAYSSLNCAIPCINANHIVINKILNFIGIEDAKNVVEAFSSIKLQNNM